MFAHKHQNSSEHSESQSSELVVCAVLTFVNDPFIVYGFKELHLVLSILLIPEYDK